MDNTLRKNYILNCIYHIFGLIMPVIMTPYLARTLGSDGIGHYGYYYAFATCFLAFAQLGISRYGNRAIARVSSDLMQRSQSFFEICLLQMLLTALVTIGYSIFVVSVLDNNAVAWIFLIMLAANAFDVTWFFFGMERFGIVVFRNFVIKIIMLFCVLAFIKKQEDVWLYALIVSGCTLSVNIWLCISLYGNVSFPESRLNLWQHLRPIFVLFLPILAVSIYREMDKVMLGAISGMKEVGYYESSERVLHIPLALVTSLEGVMLPRLSGLMNTKWPEKEKQYIYHSILFLMFATSALSFGLMGIADEFVPLFFGNGFDECVSILRILLPCCLFQAFASVIRTQYLLPRGMDIQYASVLLLGAICNVILNAVLIPRFAAFGAGAATLMTEMLVCVGHCFIVRKELPLVKYIAASFPFIGGGMVMFVILRLIRFSVFYLWKAVLLKTLIGVGLFFGIMFLEWLLVKYLFNGMSNLFNDK